jgi:hypothetical protein
VLPCFILLKWFIVTHHKISFEIQNNIGKIAKKCQNGTLQGVKNDSLQKKKIVYNLLQ